MCEFCPLDWRPLGGRQCFPLTLVFNLFLAVLSLHCCVGFSLVVVNGLILFVMLYGLLIAMASLLVERRCCLGSCGSWALEHRLKGCGPWASLLHSVWDLPGSGIESVSPALAGRLFTSEPPGKPSHLLLNSLCLE